MFVFDAIFRLFIIIVIGIVKMSIVLVVTFFMWILKTVPIFILIPLILFIIYTIIKDFFL